MTMRPRSERGTIPFPPEVFGTSRLGAPLEVWLPEPGPVETLFMAGQHGEEHESTFVLSRALRALDGPPARSAVILGANPDGLARGTRGNAGGVDLNRNFPTADWQPGPVTYAWQADSEQEVRLSTGDSAGSEPETRALMALIERLAPQRVIALHAPLACIDDPELSPLGKELAELSGLPLVDHIGYPTPGSFGTWAAARGLHVITYEFPRESLEVLAEKHVPIFHRFLV
ncbi:MAG: murein tripeptide amidase MpaA [Akkermansiaceae bacterium]|nr:murein tripeptide amidase MpaA [Akkermansiaceae bacterium]NNM28156.1 murein tripeptide amidase MpaA [Akkermansiaceae bacterium]